MSAIISHDYLYDICADMKHCVVVEKFGQCVSFEMFRESDNSFLIACVMDKASKGPFIFTTFRDCHLRSFVDIEYLMHDHPDFVGKMSRDWLSGLTFAVLNKSEEIVSEIR